MKNAVLLLFSGAVLLAASCQSETDTESSRIKSFELQTASSSILEFDHLRLYPITGASDMLEQQAPLAGFMNLEQALRKERFRITEKKPYGRFEDQQAVRTLTVQNRSSSPVFLMQGDLVRGGRQDRIIAESRVISPRTITDIAVFCVEPHRWRYQQPEADPQLQARQEPVYAFRGYYHLASRDLRKTLQERRGQKAVWDQVGKLTSRHQATTETGAYAGLETAEAFTQKRDAYLRALNEGFRGERVVGMLAVSGNRILGADVFGHPELFQKQYTSLLHSYATQAITNGLPPTIREAQLDAFWEVLQDDLQAHDRKWFRHGSLLVHYDRL